MNGTGYNSSYTQKPMKEQLETVVHRKKFVAGDSDEARITASGHSCGTLAFIVPAIIKTFFKDFFYLYMKDI